MPKHPSLTEEEAREQAQAEREFYGHLATFVVVMTGLVALNVLTLPGSLWVIWPFLGWGIGLGSHAASTFGGRVGGGWVERRTRELMGAEASEERLRALLDETLSERPTPAGDPQTLARLQRRIEHLEAIVTATDDPADPGARLDLDRVLSEPDPEYETDPASVRPAARRVR